MLLLRHNFFDSLPKEQNGAPQSLNFFQQPCKLLQMWYEQKHFKTCL